MVQRWRPSREVGLLSRNSVLFHKFCFSRSERIVPFWDGKTATLEVCDIEDSDSGIYTCVAENEHGKIESSAELTLLDINDNTDVDKRPPKIVEPLPQMIETFDGNSVQLEITVEGIVAVEGRGKVFDLLDFSGTAPFDIIWMKDDCVLPDCDDFQQIDLGNNKFALCLTDVFAKDSGEYSCEVFNIFGEVISKSQLIVKGKTCFSFRPPG